MLLISQIAQIIIALLLIVLTLIQAKGQGLSSSLANSIGFYRSRRGLEKAVFALTIFLGLLFVANSLLLLRL